MFSKELKRIVLFLMIIVLVFMLSPNHLATAQDGEICIEEMMFYFSTEEEFDNGDIYVSDGDLLFSHGWVFATNAQLLQRFGRFPDLGLDAVDVIWNDGQYEEFTEETIIAFSTELPGSLEYGVIEPGDLLITTGAIIPGHALTEPMGIIYPIGLDAVQFVGEPEAIIEFAYEVAEIPRVDWDNAHLREFLELYGIDIWFSVEGTWEHVLDGDILSVAAMDVKIPHADLLPSSPAGIPGVDFGLDAMAGLNPFPEDPEVVVYSTEILATEEFGNFTDGDILRLGSVFWENRNFVEPFEPPVDFLGLDALSVPCWE